MKFRLISSSSNIVYHGSKNDFNSFDNSFLGKGNGLNWYGAGFHFCDDKDYILEHYSKDGYIYTCEIPGMDSTLDLEENVDSQASSSKLIKLCDDYELDVKQEWGLSLPTQLCRKLGYPASETYRDNNIKKTLSTYFKSIWNRSYEVARIRRTLCSLEY